MFGMLLICSIAATQAPKSDAAREEYQAMLSRYAVAEKHFLETNRNNRDPVALHRDWPGWSFAPEFLVFAEEHRGDPAAVDALIWVVRLTTRVGATDRLLVPHLDRALVALARDVSFDDPRLRTLFPGPLHYACPASETYLRAALAHARERERIGLICLTLGELLASRARMATSHWGDGQPRDPFESFVWSRADPSVLNYVRATNPQAVRTEASAFLDRASGQYGDVVLAKVRDHVVTIADGAKIERERIADVDGGKR